MSTVTAQSVPQCPSDAPVRKCVDLTAAGRILSVATDPRLVAELGSSLALLVYAIQTCDGDGICRTTCGEVASRCGVHGKTVQNWLSKVEDVGLIVRTPKGADGVEIKINVERVGEVNLGKSALAALADVENGLLYGQSVLRHVFEKALADIRKVRD